MAKKRVRYTSAQRKAYYMGYGLGVADRDNEVPIKELDKLLSVDSGNSRALVDSSTAGFWAAKNYKKNAARNSAARKK